MDSLSTPTSPSVRPAFDPGLRVTCFLLAALTASSSLLAAEPTVPTPQEVRRSSAKAPTADASAPVQLNPFEVKADPDTSYGALNSNAITRFSAEMEKLPVSADIFTQRFMEDIAADSIEAMLQAYSALPFNITSGVTTLQGTPGRPIVDGLFIPRNAGTGSASVTVNARVSRVVTLSSRVRADVAVEAFNLLNRANVVTRNGNFGAGAYPTAPSATFGQATGVAEPRALQLAVRTRF